MASDNVRSYFSVKETHQPNLDTWEPDTNFLQLGFSPGLSLQARELIEIQSILQNQIMTFAESAGFIHGSMTRLCDTKPSVIWDGDPNNNPPTGNPFNSTINVNSSYFYVRPKNRLGYFVRLNQSQTSDVNWDYGGNYEVAFIGLNYSEITVDESTDPKLYDNANGYPNFNAPGAVRYKIEFEPGLVVKKGLIAFTDLGELDNAVNAYVKNDPNDIFSGGGFMPILYHAEIDTSSGIKIINTITDSGNLLVSDVTGPDGRC